jgi:hypothetical protein
LQKKGDPIRAPAGFSAEAYSCMISLFDASLIGLFGGLPISASQ